MVRRMVVCILKNGIVLELLLELWKGVLFEDLEDSVL